MNAVDKSENIHVITSRGVEVTDDQDGTGTSISKPVAQAFIKKIRGLFYSQPSGFSSKRSKSPLDLACKLFPWRIYMKVRQYFYTSLKLPTVVFLTALAVGATATQAFAQIMVGVGQGGNWTAENVAGSLKLQDTYSEARNAGHLLSVWRRATNNQVWMSLDNGKPFTIGGTVTFASPTVAP
jgi:hypothetical protein